MTQVSRVRSGRGKEVTENSALKCSCLEVTHGCPHIGQRSAKATLSFNRVRKFNPPTSQKDRELELLESSSHVSCRRVRKGLLPLSLPPSTLVKGTSIGKTRLSQGVFSREPLDRAGGPDMAGEELALIPDPTWMVSPWDGQSILRLSFSVNKLNRLHWLISSTSCELSEGTKSLIYSAPLYLAQYPPWIEHSVCVVKALNELAALIPSEFAKVTVGVLPSPPSLRLSHCGF